MSAWPARRLVSSIMRTNTHRSATCRPSGAARAETSFNPACSVMWRLRRHSAWYCAQDRRRGVGATQRRSGVAEGAGAVDADVEPGEGAGEPPALQVGEVADDAEQAAAVGSDERLAQERERERRSAAVHGGAPRSVE